jgi:hypothetical protein
VREYQKAYRREKEKLAALELSDEERRQVLANMVDPGASWTDAYTQAAELLKGTPAFGSPETIKHSYQLVAKAHKDREQDGRFYVASPRTMRRLGIEL